MMGEKTGFFGGRVAIAGCALVLAVVWCLPVAPELLLAQGASQPGTTQMRHFWHVFAAYAFAWMLLLGWVASIFRRIRKVERLLDP